MYYLSRRHVVVKEKCFEDYIIYDLEPKEEKTDECF